MEEDGASRCSASASVALYHILSAADLEDVLVHQRDRGVLRQVEPPRLPQQHVEGGHEPVAAAVGLLARLPLVEHRRLDAPVHAPHPPHLNIGPVSESLSPS